MDLRKTRIARTKALLKSTFITLMESRSPHEITVVELCRTAGLNRSSFYAHYGYMDDLIRDIVFDCVAEVCDNVKRKPLDMTEDGGIHRRRIAVYLDAFLSNDTLRRLCTCEDSDLFRADIVSAHVKITLGDYRPTLTTPMEKARKRAEGCHVRFVMQGSASGILDKQRR